MSTTNQQPPLVTASQIPAMMDKQVISGIEGTLTRLYERKSGTNSNGDWSIQNGEITDATGKIPITIHDRPELPQSMKGQQVKFLSKATQNGTHGVKVFDDTYRNNTTRKLKITGSCEIVGMHQQQPQQPTTSLQDGYPPGNDPNYDPPFDEATQGTPPPQNQPHNSGQQNGANPANRQPDQPPAQKPPLTEAPPLPEGAVVRSITYREVRQKREFEPVTFEMTIDLPQGGKISQAWKYAEAAGNACLKHSCGR